MTGQTELLTRRAQLLGPSYRVFYDDIIPCEQCSRCDHRYQRFVPGRGYYTERWYFFWYLDQQRRDRGHSWPGGRNYDWRRCRNSDHQLWPGDGLLCNDHCSS